MMAAFIARLEAAARPPLNLVKGGADFASLKAPPPRHLQPAAYVMPASATGGANRLATGGVRQPLVEQVSVMIAIGNLSDPRGEAAAIDLSQVIDAVRGAIVGWRPAEGWGLCEFVSGQLVDISEGVLTWREVYAVAGHLRSR